MCIQFPGNLREKEGQSSRVTPDMATSFVRYSYGSTRLAWGERQEGNACNAVEILVTRDEGV